MAVAQQASSAVRLEPAASLAAERLFQEHSGWLYGYCLRLLRSPEEAEDALQATYLNACRSLKDGFVPRADSAWLLKVAQNVCITRLRSSGRRARVERLHDAELIEETIAAPERSADELIGLPEALASLPEQQRRAILLREWQGLSYREVAAKLRLSQAAVETLIFRARRSLASALREGGGRRTWALPGLNLGGLAAGLKSLVAGSAATQLATVAVVAVTATVVAADPIRWHRPAVQDGTAETATKAPASAAAATAPRAYFQAAEPEKSAPAQAHESSRGAKVRSSAPRKTKTAVSDGKSQRPDGERQQPVKVKQEAEPKYHERGTNGAVGKSLGRESAGRPSFAGSGGLPPHAAAPAQAAVAQAAPAQETRGKPSKED